MNAAATPGYLDDHLHLLACAAARRSVDVSDAASIPDMLALVRRAVRGRSDHGSGGDMAADAWLRAWGYDDALLVERRHPTVAELDAATADRPTVLHHITGHVAVVNTAAAHALGLAAADVLTERHDLLARVPRPDRSTTVAAVGEVLVELAAAGFTACTDTTHTNDVAALELLADASAAEPSVEITAMIGCDRLDTLGDVSFGMDVTGSRAAAAAQGQGCVRVGHVKVMPPHDDEGVVAEMVAVARDRGFPVAVHAMDIDTLQATLDALEAQPPSQPEPDRIEHCALALPEQLDRIARLGIAVVTQPSFVTRRAQKYQEQLSAIEQGWLWPLASLVRRGIRVTFSSDAPTVPADPQEWIEAATSRTLAPAERVDRTTARRLCQRD
ncbi:amidohydrolase family protein [Candidatus Poriferisodalis sp.]|uniref:amidohydrolase family protein n=1 Tax=Candidatus Poriferisodalis sp. TaxID=3101277 RepID=UPI003B0247C2